MDRLTYAFIGALFGCVIGAVCWWLYGIAMSRHIAGTGLLQAALPWVKAGGFIFGILGFIFKNRVGSAAGSVIASIFNFEAGNHPRETHLTWPQTVFVLAVLGALAWYLLG